MTKATILIVYGIFFASCSDSAPTSTTYKKSISSSSGSAPIAASQAPGAEANPAATPASNPAALLKQGQDLYAAKCLACHKALAAPSAKKGATVARITAAAAISQHATVKPFPTPAEITALETALK